MIPPYSLEPELDRRGYIDNSIVYGIALIVVAIAVPKLFQSFTGQTLVEYWRGLPADRTTFAVRLLALLTVVIVASAVAAIAGGHKYRASRVGDEIVIATPQPGGTVFGCGLLLVAIYMASTGSVGEGFFWWVVVATSLLPGALALAVLAANDRIVVTEGSVRLESRFLRSVTSAVECPVRRGESARVSVTESTTGGAFGQPLTVHHHVEIAGKVLRSMTSEDRAGGLRDAIADALAELGRAPGA